MAIEGINVNLPTVEALVSNQQAIENGKEENRDDAADAARKKIIKKIALKKATIKSNDAHREVFQKGQDNQQQMQQILGGAAGPDAADALGKWEQNGDLQQKLTTAQREKFQEAMAKNPPKATQTAKALDDLSQQPSFKTAIADTQQMGTLQKSLIDNPENAKPAREIIENRFMQSKKADPKTKGKFLEFGMKQAQKGKMASVRKAGDMLGSLAQSGVGRGGQRAAMNMVQRTGGDARASGEVDAFVQDPNVGKMPDFARGKATELLSKTDGKQKVAEGFKELAGNGKFQSQTGANQGRFFATIGTGRPSEYRAITDTLLGSLQSGNIPKRDGQVKKFLGNIATQVQTKGGKLVNSQSALKASKASPMPKLKLIPMDAENMDEEELAQARSQNRANVMQYFNSVSRIYDKGEKTLRSAKYLEDVNQLQTIRLPEEIDTSSLTQEEAAFVKDRQGAIQERYKKVSNYQRQRARELRTKRRRRGKAGGNRPRGPQPKYFSPGITRGGNASEAFLQTTGTHPTQSLPHANSGRPMGKATGGSAVRGGDIHTQVASAMANIGDGPMTAEGAGQIAQTIATQVAKQVVSQVTEQLMGRVVTKTAQTAPVTEPNVPQKPIQQGKIDGWGIPRSFEADLGGRQNAVVRAPMQETPQVQEAYTGKMLIKDPSSIRGLNDLFAAPWVDLSKPESALLKNLGWSQKTWDTKNTPAARWPRAMVTSFVQLLPVQREAVRKLGFTAHDWDTRVQAFASGKNA